MGDFNMERNKINELIENTPGLNQITNYSWSKLGPTIKPANNITRTNTPREIDHIISEIAMQNQYKITEPGEINSDHSFIAIELKCNEAKKNKVTILNPSSNKHYYETA